MQLTSKTSQDLAPTGVDIDVEIGVIPTVTGAINLLTKIAKIAVKTRFTLFTQLQAHSKFPDPYAKLTSKYLNDASMFHGGDCRVPHLMEYNGYAGYANLAVTLPTSLNVKDIVTRDYEPVVLTSTDRFSTNLISGCIAVAYSVGISLFVTLDDATLLTDKKQTALKNILTWALGVPEIDPTFVTIVSISTSTGEVVTRISVPPSVSATYPTAPQLVTQLYQNARTATFAATLV
ncbi:hypothetical protein PF005_g30597 [Phytophthora fragariae]|uniref:Uncharacterized protein n=3 Tax=Phytophthora TaxID=4783 RepID=A0A6A3U4K9_9STRA|nr:hypothetical protein PF009_g31019 [Phytophthora fragariae]KAE8964265.1 hypothetical protein PF011_g28735 [Phytophthora fragariae]KAE9061813.1 hypothetical protein PF007_g30126 [Phytophthora fragariae]KAE9144602.1 hypothetical protein PF006_g10474 [Phytophthora fragariae]KAE9163063.1 hypothetical protein PF005_g30597 [Phytophthora fragariae]